MDEELHDIVDQIDADEDGQDYELPDLSELLKEINQ